MSEPSKKRVVETARSDFAKSTKSLKAVRQSRLQLQKEAQLLQNRLRVLKLEEARARKRIHIAREKAVKILEIRREQDEEIELRLGAKKKESRRRKLLRKKLRIDRELIKSQILVRTSLSLSLSRRSSPEMLRCFKQTIYKIQLNKQQDVEEKMKSVKMQKMQSLKNKNKIQKQKRLQMEKAKRNTNIIKRQRDVRRQKLKDMKAATMYSAKEEYDNRLRGEFELRSQEERRVCFFWCFLSFIHREFLYTYNHNTNSSRN